MPDWILAPICVVILVGFIAYAFRQGIFSTESGRMLQEGRALPTNTGMAQL